LPENLETLGELQKVDGLLPVLRFPLGVDPGKILIL
jgi:hypothetical protein